MTLVAPPSGLTRLDDEASRKSTNDHASENPSDQLSPTMALMQLNSTSSCSSDIDRFSLHSNLSDSSPISSHGLDSRTSSICCGSSHASGHEESQTSSACVSPSPADDISITNKSESTTKSISSINIDKHKVSISSSDDDNIHNNNNNNNNHNNHNHNNNNNDSTVTTGGLESDSARRPSLRGLSPRQFNPNLSPDSHGPPPQQLSPQQLSVYSVKLLPSSPSSTTSLTPARRPSRSEHRQSLSDLGYGKMESYTKLQRLGKGTYATVYLGRSRLSNDLVALKEILKEHDEGAPCTAIREVSLLRLLRHNNIVTLHDVCHTPKKLTLVFEYVGPDLYAYMKENNHLLSIHNVRLLLFQLLRGISFCHARHVLHRDLKPQNLLLNTRGELKICDFGLARAKSIPTKSYSNEVVTLWYRPPDVLLGNTDYDHSIDIWGVGCIFFEMASGRTFFPGSSIRQQLYLIFSCLGTPNRLNWPETLQNPEYQQYNFPAFRPEKLAHRVPRLDADGMNLLMKFLRYKPSERISADEAKREPFFSMLPEKIHHLNERESIFDVPGVYMSLNPGQKLNHM